tara:strand:- start:39 stop:1865 length:1827 start_codon:yes stop_codon:yes gene_type:complete
MSDIRFNRWLHQSGTGGVSQDSSGNIGIGSTQPLSALDLGTGNIRSHNIHSTGIVTTTGLDINGNADISGNLNVGGVLTYEDVTNIDSVGIVTTRTGIDVTGGHIDLVDNSMIRVGTGDDLQIYHNNTHNIFKSINGHISLQAPAGTEIQLAQGGGGTFEHGVRFIVGSSVELYHNNSKKLETTTTGAKVTGALEVTQEYPSIRPTLDLNFAATKTLDRRITFTRDSLGTFTDDMGIVRYASNNVPRFDHDPTTGESLGLLIEESRTNQILYSTLHTDNWNVSTGAILSNNTTETTAPDGTNTAGKWVPANGAIGWCSIYNKSVISVTSGTTYTYSVWAKATHSDFTGFNISGDVRDGGGITITANFVLSGDGSVSGTYDSASITKYPNGWYRCVATATSDATTNEEPGFRPTANGDGTKGFYAWGYQVEAGSFPTSYIPTSGSTVTRAQDTAKITGTNFTDFFNKDEGTLFVNYKLDKANYLYSPAGVELVTFKADSNSGRYSIRIVSNASIPQLDAYGIDDSTAQYDIVGINLSDGLKDYLVAKAFKLNDMAISFNGAAPQTDGSVTVIEWDKLLIGTDPKRAHYKSVKYYTKRLPNAQLQGLTQQ